MREGGSDPSRPANPARDDECLLRGPADRRLDLDDVFDLLSRRERRIVLHHLRSREDEWVPLADLVDRVHAWEEEVGAGSSVAAEPVETALVHRHLPKLAAAAVIEYDHERRLAIYRGTDRVDQFLDLALREGPLP